jgi:hypothetical protein
MLKKKKKQANGNLELESFPFPKFIKPYLISNEDFLTSSFKNWSVLSENL